MREALLVAMLIAPAAAQAQEQTQYIRCQTSIETAERRSSYLADYVREPGKPATLFRATGTEMVFPLSVEFADGIRPSGGNISAWHRVERVGQVEHFGQAGFAETLEGDAIRDQALIEIAIVDRPSPLSVKGYAYGSGRAELSLFANWLWNEAWDGGFSQPFTMQVRIDGKVVATARFDATPLAQAEQVMASRLARWDAVRNGGDLPAGCAIEE
ncbi:hypothetical protein P1X14_15535 [Sphingomonas sp. AOB5]|uniref:hypothetical protein n=1 Tax=Sphingomonas sp. AOB5 TaxID=3034017 RepID=UPI0023F62140|nr:hypothetical protein [Sphingomonas sp. AOB5]MDF7776669.1 hypothetical protein [Sphingomonas sp. AOB5]